MSSAHQDRHVRIRSLARRCFFDSCAKLGDATDEQPFVAGLICYSNLLRHGFAELSKSHLTPRHSYLSLQGSLGMQLLCRLPHVYWHMSQPRISLHAMERLRRYEQKQDECFEPLEPRG